MNDIELVRLISQGYSSKQIAAELRYSEVTIESYRFRLFRKYNCKNAPHLVAHFYETGKIIPKNMEMWRDVNGYEGIYEVSNLGGVKSVARSTNNQYCREDIMLSPSDDGYGYNQVVLCKRINGIRVKKTFKVHRLVADAFIENPHNKPIVNHKDWNTKNNTVDNLNWMTPKENLNHRDPSKLKNRKGNEIKSNQVNQTRPS